jgi:hypothetical protein
MDRDRDINGQGCRWTGARTQRGRERVTNRHGQGYGHGHRQLYQTTYKKIRALNALSFKKFNKTKF